MEIHDISDLPAITSENTLRNVSVGKFLCSPGMKGRFELSYKW